MSLPPFTPTWRPGKPARLPRAFREAPPLDPSARVGAPARNSILLINPFYAKDPHASFGKHVLTPTLALTSIAGATPPGWRTRYWDENLLQGPPPHAPFPEVVGITVHLHDCGIQVNGSFVLGFDHDRPDCFEQLMDWIEACRMENATFHILTPYPGTPLFRQMEAEGRLLHRNWDLYDTAHTVFRPRHMEPEVLEASYAWCYERLLSVESIWKRRPRQADAVLPYLAMMLLYKRSNTFWEFLIRRRMVSTAWRPLVEVTRRRHLRYRRALERAAPPAPAALPVGAAPRAAGQLLLIDDAT
jgi:hypothetical protein